MPVEVCRAVQRHRAIEQRLGADGRQLFIEQAQRRQRAVRWCSVHDGRVELFAVKVHAVLHGGGQLHRHVRTLLLPLQQTWQ
ncbi:hypothetical protein D3C81_1956700 [compost metagenome]